MLNDSSNEESKFATKKWYVIDSQTAKGKYKQGDTTKFETETIKSSLCDYSDASILVTGDIMPIIQILRLKIVHHFLHVQKKLMIYLLTKANHIYSAMLMYNLIDYSDKFIGIEISLIRKFMAF